LNLAALLLSRITRKTISTSQLRDNHEAVRTILGQLMEGSRSDKTVTLEYDHKRFAVSVGLTDHAETRMAEARAQLNSYILAEPR
jgi:hypothetical protein